MARRSSRSGESASVDHETQGFFALRTPLLPFEVLATWGEGLEASHRPQDKACWCRDVETLQARLAELVGHAVVREAFHIASPTFEAHLDRWLEQPDDRRGRRAERTLVSYLARMAGRATPFGLFAGCSLGAVDSEAGGSRLRLGGRELYRRSCRLDNDYLLRLTDALGRDPEIRGRLVYRPNESLYRVGESWRYAEPRLEDHRRSHHLVSAEADEYLDATLERARAGATLACLALALTEEDDELTEEEARQYLDELVDGQLLVSDLAPVVTGPQPIDDLIATLSTLSAAGETVRGLEATRAALDRLEDPGLSHDPASYRALATNLESLPVPVDPSRLLQVDLFKPVDGALLGREPVREVERAIKLLHRLTPRLEDPALRAFRQQFVERWDQQQVPLIEVLDEELGIGFSRPPAAAARSPLLAGIPLAEPDEEPHRVSWGPLQALLLGKLQCALSEGHREISLTDADLDSLPDLRPHPLPDVIAVVAVLAAASPEALSRGDFRIWLKSVTGPTGAQLLGRFCHGDAELLRHIRQLLRVEEGHHPEAVFAEVVHLPEGRIDNILCRPLLRRYEIPYLGRSGAPPERRISCSDLLVSVEGERVVLRSRFLGREVIPSMTNAHNFRMGSVGIYNFLCSLQGQGVTSGMTFDWGEALEAAPYLPRVVHGRQVLARARWLLTGPEIGELSGLAGHSRFARVQELRHGRGLPRWITLVDGDNELPVDLDNALSVRNLVRTVKGRPAARLAELFPPPEELCAAGPEGRFVHEIVLPLARPAPERAAARVAGPRPVAAPSQARPQRVFLPGSEWLYLRLFLGTATADNLLRRRLGPLARHLMTEGLVDRWHYLRYGDPRWHLRIRLHGQPEVLLSRVLPLARHSLAPFLDSGELAELEVATYRREIERYGGPAGIELAEELFSADSLAAVALLERYPGDQGMDARWRLATLGIDRLLEDLAFELGDRRHLLERLKESFAHEFGIGRSARRRLGDRFREHRLELEALLDRPRAQAGGWAPALEVFDRRSRDLCQPIARLRQEIATGAVALPIEDLAASYVHMHVNRLLRAGHRAHEAVLYDFLFRLYDGRLARRHRQQRRPKVLQG